MIDIHTHVIPYVDDGSPSIEESIMMIEEEISNGVDTIICTPHHSFGQYEKSKEEIISEFNKLCSAVKEKGLPVKLILGQEIFYSKYENIIEKLNNKELLTIGDTNCVLIEFSFLKEPEEDIVEIMYKLKLNKYRPILAHVERYEWLNIAKIEELKANDVMIQVNANAILGVKEGKKDKRLVKKLIKKDLVDFIASDIHSFRPTNIALAKKKIKKDHLFDGCNIFQK